MAQSLSDFLSQGTTFKGEVGFTGSQGAGFTGSQGGTGFTGSRGNTGFTGSQGVGFAGSQGGTGFTGSKGDVGFTGSQGVGFTGSQGDVGFTGSKGDVGFTGSQGVGFTGSVGFSGSQGGTGFTGSRGNTGFTGSQGVIGFTGSAATVDAVERANDSPYQIVVWDNRSTDTLTDLGDAAAAFELKSNSTDGLSDGGSYHGVMTFQPWNDASGGSTYQLAFTGNGNLWTRNATIGDPSWGSWSEIWTSFNDGAGSGLDADLLDGINSSQFLRSDANDTLTGELTVQAPMRIDQNGSSGNIAYDSSGGCYIPKPLGGSFRTNASTVTGGIAVKLPTAAFGTNDMLSFWVDIYDYAGSAQGESVSLYIYGYQRGASSWLNYGAVVLSDRTDKDYTVRFGHDGTRNIVYIGETTSTWGYPQVTVRDFQAGYVASYANYDGAFDITFETTFLNVSGTSTNNYPAASNAQQLDGINSSQFLRSDTTDTMSGRLKMGNVLDMFNFDIEGASAIIHHEDTNTYMQFHASDQWRVVTAGVERLEVTSTAITMSEPLTVNDAIIPESVQLGAYTILYQENNLEIEFNGNRIFSLDNAGNLTVIGNVTAYGSI